VATLCLFGTYDPDAPRLKRLMAGWEAQGGTVIGCHAPMWPEAGARAELPGSGGMRDYGARWLVAQVRLWELREAVKRADVVLVPYPGHMDMPLARRLTRWYQKPLLFDPFLSMWDTAVGDRKLYKPTSQMAFGIHWLDWLALHGADGVLADTAQMAEFYAMLATLPARRFTVVPVGADESLFVPAPEAPETGEVLFYGRMIPLHGIPTIVEAARRLPEVSFHLVGEGQVDVDSLVADLPNVRRTRALPYAELPAAIAQAALCLGIFSGGDKASRVVPHKIYEAAAMGKAIVTADTPAIREAFPAGALALVPPADPEALAEAIRSLLADPTARQRLGDAARARFEEAFTTRAIGEALGEAAAKLGVKP
jgi:glycosyltransferase involved in cell wall biosynthesis